MTKFEGTGLFQDAPMVPSSAPTNVHVGFWNRKVRRPSYIVLTRDIDLMGYSATGRKYGVSDNAVRKRERAYLERIGQAVVKQGVAGGDGSGAKSHTEEKRG